MGFLGSSYIEGKLRRTINERVHCGLESETGGHSSLTETLTCLVERKLYIT